MLYSIESQQAQDGSAQCHRVIPGIAAAPDSDGSSIRRSQNTKGPMSRKTKRTVPPAPKRPRVKDPTRLDIEIYVQPGKLGYHAGGRDPVQEWAANDRDPITAAFKCALKHWFPVRPNNVVLYHEARAVTVRQTEPNRFIATLDLLELAKGDNQLKRDVQTDFANYQLSHPHAS